MSTLLTVAACDEPAAYDERPDAGDDDTQFRTTYGSGSGANPPVYGNTCAIGDHAFNEIDNTGKFHDGSKLLAVYPYDPIVKAFVGSSFSEVWVGPDGEIQGRRNGVIYGGNHFQGSRWVIETERDGVPQVREMTIHSYQQDPLHGLHTYVFGYPNNPAYGPHAFGVAATLTGGNRSACVPDEDGNIEAVMLGNFHVDLETAHVEGRGGTLMFACMSGALGKALKWGYRPGTLLVDTDTYETAIRMVRADYCGDGVSWTEPGQEIDIQDQWNINTWKNPVQFTDTEAIWGPKGAICIGTPRLQEQFASGDIVCPDGPPPPCDHAFDASTYENLGKIWTRIAPLR